MSPEVLLYQFEMAFARTINYPRNKQYQADLILFEKEILCRLGGSYDTFDRYDQLKGSSYESDLH